MADLRTECISTRVNAGVRQVGLELVRRPEPLTPAGQSFSSSSLEACTPNGANSAVLNLNFLPMKAMKDLHFDTEKECPKKYFLKRGMHAFFGQNEWPKIGHQIGKLIALHSCGWLAAEHLEVGAKANRGVSLSLGPPAIIVGLPRPPFLTLVLARGVSDNLVQVASQVPFLTSQSQ
ncbi:Hypothetical predicted protein [Cloeon dipterum]|uniref:Uncharacterized protein n=1 Tax=Cloeon dipterum TaxID=197152 RepID=A0A8S1CRI9_9INSE|nr:Hypothetical predicted protein [Cloeon dipterum]